jgi:uncharacterized protein
VIFREPAQALDRRMRTVWAVEGAIVTAALGVGLAVAVTALVIAGASTWALVAGVGGTALLVPIAFVLIWVLPRHLHRHFRYEVTELALYVARGWLWRRWQVVPHARIETVDVKSGPILRAFGLVAVEVATAAVGGGTGIPGLTPDAADALVEQLARRAAIEVQA